MDFGYANNIQSSRGTLIQVHIADIHFGAFDPKTQYQILCEQFINPIIQLPKLDVIVVDGDLFDHKVMSNSDVAMYATMFVDQLVNIARNKNSTLVILSGTFSHDYDQLKLFYHYMEDKSVDVRIITTIKFENIKGARVLCIPELYGLDESIYQKFFFQSGYYDEAFVHGTYQGSVYGDTVGAGRLLTEKDFQLCTGVAISGHVHKSGCFNGFYYYCGCPYRWKFGEEEDKGFLILGHDLDTQYHYVEFMKIESFRYDTIFLDQLISEDPKEIIDYINQLKQDQGIDYIKVKFRYPIAGYNKTVINNYYRTNPYVTPDFSEIKKEELKNQDIIDAQNQQYNYLMDKSINDFDRFVKYVNDNEGYEFITVQKLNELLSEAI